MNEFCEFCGADMPEGAEQVNFAAVSMALALVESFQITVEFPDVDFVPFFAERCRQLFGGSLEPAEYSYSYDEEYWHGGFSSHEDALAEGLSDLCEERTTIYTARTVRRDVDADDYEGDGYPIDTYDVREHDVPEDEEPQAMGHLCSFVEIDGVRLCRHCGQTHESQMVGAEQIRAVLEKFRR